MQSSRQFNEIRLKNFTIGTSKWSKAEQVLRKHGEGITKAAFLCPQWDQLKQATGFINAVNMMTNLKDLQLTTASLYTDDNSDDICFATTTSLNLTKLTTLKVSGNNMLNIIEKIPAGVLRDVKIRMPNDDLTVFFQKQSSIRKLEISNLSDAAMLQHLQIEEFLIDEFDRPQLVELFKLQPQLVKLKLLRQVNSTTVIAIIENLKNLQLLYFAVGIVSSELVAQISQLHRLKELSIKFQGDTQTIIDVLSRGIFPSLRTLHLKQWDFQVSHVDFTALSQSLPRISELNLSGICPDNLYKLLNGFERLETLSLRNLVNSVGNSVIRLETFCAEFFDPASAKSHTKLTKLFINPRNGQISAEHLQPILYKKFLPNLKDLHVVQSIELDEVMIEMLEGLPKYKSFRIAKFHFPESFKMNMFSGILRKLCRQMESLVLSFELPSLPCSDKRSAKLLEEFGMLVDQSEDLKIKDRSVEKQSITIEKRQKKIQRKQPNTKLEADNFAMW